jgi:hypothetical protein
MIAMPLDVQVMITMSGVWVFSVVWVLLVKYLK